MKKYGCTGIFFLALTALGSGLVLDALFDAVNVPAGPVGHTMLPAGFKIAAAILLLLVLVVALLPVPKHETCSD